MKCRFYFWVQLVCSKDFALPFVAAISRAFPLFSVKTGKSGNNNSSTEEGTPVSSGTTIVVELLLVDEAEGGGCSENLKLSESELACLTDVSKAVRNTAKIVDMPCNYFDVQRFTEVIRD
jgi:probable aminopeptidase NPEPL1